MPEEVIVGLGPHGRLRGTRSFDVAYRFLDIPYALPPIGDRRWKKPSPLPEDYNYSEGSQRPRDCTKFGNICYQPPYVVNGNNLSLVPGCEVSSLTRSVH